MVLNGWNAGIDRIELRFDHQLMKLGLSVLVVCLAAQAISAARASEADAVPQS